jgi:hypothetical protein
MALVRFDILFQCIELYIFVVTASKVEVLGDLSAEVVKKAHQLLEDHHITGKLVINVP